MQVTGSRSSSSWLPGPGTGSTFYQLVVQEAGHVSFIFGLCCCFEGSTVHFSRPGHRCSSVIFISWDEDPPWYIYQKIICHLHNYVSFILPKQAQSTIKIHGLKSRQSHWWWTWHVLRIVLCKFVLSNSPVIKTRIYLWSEINLVTLQKPFWNTLQSAFLFEQW